MSKQLKNTTPKLQRTKLYSAPRSSASSPRTPYDRNYDNNKGYGGLDYRDEIALAKAAHEYPAELAGVLGGMWLGNFIERGQGNEADALLYNTSKATDGVLQQYGRNNNPTSTEDLIQQTYGTNNITADNYLNDSIASATEAEAQAMKNSNASIAAGQTAQEMNAVRNNMNEVAKTAIFATTVDDMAKLGDSPKTAKHALSNYRDQFDALGQANLTNVPDEVIRDSIWKIVNSRKGVSRNVRLGVFQEEYANKLAQKAQQQEQLGTELYGKLLFTNPERFMKSQDFGVLQNLSKINRQAAAPAMGILEKYALAKNNNEMALENMRKEAAVKNELVNMYDWMNPITLKQAGKTASNGTKKTKDVVEYDEDGNVVYSDKELSNGEKKILAMQKNTDYMVTKIAELSERLKTMSKNAPEYKTTQDQIKILSSRLNQEKRRIKEAEAIQFAKTNPEEAKKVYLENKKRLEEARASSYQKGADMDTQMGIEAFKMMNGK